MRINESHWCPWFRLCLDFYIHVLNFLNYNFFNHFNFFNNLYRHFYPYLFLNHNRSGSSNCRRSCPTAAPSRKKQYATN